MIKKSFVVNNCVYSWKQWNYI